MAKKVFVCVLALVLSLSFVLFNIFSKQLSMDNHENRFLTRFPAVLASKTGPEFIHNMNEFMIDSAPFRYKCVKLVNEWEYRIFKTTDSSQVILGKEGWMFLKDGPNSGTPLANYQGVLTYPQEEIELFSGGLEQRKNFYEKLGTTLTVVFAPCKPAVYGEFIPDCYPVINEENRTDTLADYVYRNTSVIMSYEKDRMRELKDDVQLYFPRDTHWNHAGALVALDKILLQLGLPVETDFEQYGFKEGDPQEMDLPNLCGLYDMFPLCTDRVAANYEYEKDPRSVLVIGDSYSQYFVPYLEKRFTSVQWEDVRSCSMDELVMSTQPDIVILEANERYMDAMFRQINGF